MEHENRPDLKISGAGSAGGGKYNDVKISGSGRVDGDIECFSFTTSGSSDIRGNMKAEDVRVSGSSHIKGGLSCANMSVSGSLKVENDSDVSYVKVSGSVHFGGSVRGGEIDIKGGVRINGDCEADSFSSKGGFTIDGLLNADTINITLYGDSRAREIGGERIQVVKSTSSVGSIAQAFLDLVSLHIGSLTADSIEGDNISLEGTRAKVVRGSNVIIGQGCSIDLVEYRDNITVTNGAFVKEQRKL